MTGRDIFKIWAPTDSKWTNWVRPVPFVGINYNFNNYEVGNFTIPNCYFLNKLSTDTAIIVDLPGNESIKKGLAIAKLGFIPIPIYNGTDTQEGARATVDNQAIKTGLIEGATELKNMKINKDAPPVFLLDSNRTNRYKMDISIFDNSWDIYAQDMPSAEYFKSNNIYKIIIVADFIQNDLKKILYTYQTKGIQILFTQGYEEPKNVVIKKTKEKPINQV